MDLFFDIHHLAPTEPLAVTRKTKCGIKEYIFCLLTTYLYIILLKQYAFVNIEHDATNVIWNCRPTVSASIGPFHHSSRPQQGPGSHKPFLNYPTSGKPLPTPGTIEPAKGTLGTIDPTSGRAGTRDPTSGRPGTTPPSNPVRS